jgi:hypothetical protein
MALLSPAFFMECQLQHNWCWAAVTAAVKQYSPPLPPVRQCEVATATLPRGRDCCGSPDACDRPFRLKDALDGVGKLKNFLRGQISFVDIQRQIDVYQQPVCARIGWDTDRNGIATTFHFVVIVGWEVSTAGEEIVKVMDPDVGIASPAGVTASDVHDVPLELFKSHYRTYGIWMRTYTVK